MAVLGGMCINTTTVSPFNFKTSLPRVEGYSADFSSETLPHAKPSSAAFCSPTLDKTPKIPPASLSQSSQNDVLGEWVLGYYTRLCFCSFVSHARHIPKVRPQHRNFRDPLLTNSVWVL